MWGRDSKGFPAPYFLGVDLPTFRNQFPEFGNAPDSFIEAFLAAAALEIDTRYWGLKADQGQGYLAAHKITLSPWGQAARLVAKDGVTTYWTHYIQLRGQVGRGAMVL